MITESFVEAIAQMPARFAFVKEYTDDQIIAKLYYYESGWCLDSWEAQRAVRAEARLRGLSI